MTFDYTIVVGVDQKHLEHLNLVLPTWAKHKPSLLKKKLVIFYDYPEVNVDVLRRLVLSVGFEDVDFLQWPPPGVVYKSTDNTRFGDAQRYKMLSGFVHVPRWAVTTSYWLKLDLDVVATGVDDWVDWNWFSSTPAIVAHPWGYTKPPTQMLELDTWADAKYVPFTTSPLNLHPSPGALALSHSRIISWCGFFNSAFSHYAGSLAERYCGLGKLPVPSQDGFHWYMAQRMGLEVRRERMKGRGWEHCANLRRVREAAEKSMRT